MQKYTLRIIETAAEDSFRQVHHYRALATQKFYCFISIPVFLGVLVYAIVVSDESLSLQSLLSLALTVAYVICICFFKRGQETLNYTYNVALMIANVAVVRSGFERHEDPL